MIRMMQANHPFLKYYQTCRGLLVALLLRSVLSKQVMTAVLFCVILAVTSLPSVFHHSHLLAVYHGTVSTEFYYELWANWEMSTCKAMSRINLSLTRANSHILSSFSKRNYSRSTEKRGGAGWMRRCWRQFYNQKIKWHKILHEYFTVELENNTVHLVRKQTLLIKNHGAVWVRLYPYKGKGSCPSASCDAYHVPTSVEHLTLIEQLLRLLLWHPRGIITLAGLSLDCDLSHVPFNGKRSTFYLKPSYTLSLRTVPCLLTLKNDQ